MIAITTIALSAIGIEHGAELAFLFPQASQIAIEIVGDRRAHKEGKREPVSPGTVEIQEHHNHARRRKQTYKRQDVRNVPIHVTSPILSFCNREDVSSTDSKRRRKISAVNPLNQCSP
jgi:hypothetical protein